MIDAMRILLQIATHDYPKLPQKLDFPELVRLAQVAARWECHASLAPFVDAWAATWRARMFHPKYVQCLYTAHEFGCESEYLDISRNLAARCSVNAQDQLLALDDTILERRGAFPFQTLGTSLTL